MTLLFVDDDPPVLRAMERMMRAHRCEWHCHFAGDPRAALDTLSAVAPDAIVCDMLMPGLDGIEFLDEAARRHPIAARFILSGEVGAGAFVRMARSAHQCLSKPCRGDVLLDVVRQAVGAPRLVTPRAVREGLYRLSSLPVAAPRLLALRRALGGSDGASREASAVAIVQGCAGLSTKLLQIATWTQIGVGPAPRHVRDAFGILGVDAVAALLDAGVVAAVPNGRTTPLHLDLWARAERAAARAATTARAAGSSHDAVDRAALVALWSEGAPLLLDAVAPGRYPRLDHAAAPGDRARAEQAVFGIDAATALAQLLRLWGLPEALCSAVGSVSPPSPQNRAMDEGAQSLAPGPPV